MCSSSRSTPRTPLSSARRAGSAAGARGDRRTSRPDAAPRRRARSLVRVPMSTSCGPSTDDGEPSNDITGGGDRPALASLRILRFGTGADHGGGRGRPRQGYKGASSPPARPRPARERERERGERAERESKKGRRPARRLSHREISKGFSSAGADRPPRQVLSGIIVIIGSPGRAGRPHERVRESSSRARPPARPRPPRGRPSHRRFHF